jgi:hypothetical protein
MRRFVGVAFLAVAAVACSSGSKGAGSTGDPNAVPLMAGFNPGPAPDPSLGFQVITPAVDDVEPGASDEYCTWTNMILANDTWVSASQGVQSETGHHIIVYYSPSHQTPDTHLCSNSEMSEFHFGMPASNGGEKFLLPGNLAVKLPAGSQLVVNHHYLNAGATAVAAAQSAINVYYADPTQQHTPSASTVVLDTQLTVPVGASTYEVNCTINQTYASWLQMPHMHAWGTHITVTHTPAATGTPTQLFDMDWDPNYAFDPTGVEKTYDPSSPYIFSTGDKVNVKCQYMNTTGSPMTFGDEMCVFATFTVDPNNFGNMECDRGQWGSY